MISFPGNAALGTLVAEARLASLAIAGKGPWATRGNSFEHIEHIEHINVYLGWIMDVKPKLVPLA